MNRLDQQLQLNQKQQLRMTTELLQSIRILQMTHLELTEYIAQEMLENPVLEEAAPEGSGDLSADELRERIEAETEDRYDAYDRWDRYDDRSREPGIAAFEKYVQQEETLQSHLMEQLKLSNLAGGAYRACEFMIYNMDEDGYLTLDEETKQVIQKECFANQWDIELALEMLQSMDPAGVGARDLRECLRLQLARKGRLTKELRALIDERLSDIAENRIGEIAKAFSFTKKEAQAMADTIRKLEPKPGRRFSDGQAVQYVQPDVIVERQGDHLVIYSNEQNVPKLQISSYYRDLVPEVGDDKELLHYLSDRFKAADQLIRGIDQRRDTIVRVTTSILKHQRAFFESGSRFLRPLTLQQVADDIGVHVSTVSRAVDGKYMQVQGGTYSLRHFFGSGISSESGAPDAYAYAGTQGTNGIAGPDAEDVLPEDAGSGVSASTIQEMIRTLVESEDPKKPLSDQKIADTLNANGIPVARRTVAKYRENAGIAAASRRRRY
ncbi:MAG: RNA polymerase factor sigma-54 [Mogibacterium sp.]|nr:RNA polymerase factor sigma-54 [Mogibacterium sp.]